MFGNRRRKTPSNPALNGSHANPSAAMAAAQAFLKNQASNASLSSAAAAAALRSRPTSPTSVADVQTKRTLRRSGSTSSMGSSAAGSSSGAARPSSSLQRKGSSGSMTERTFRDPSPSPAVPSAVDAPPVPALPKNIPAIPPKSHRRAMSLEALRVASPPPNKANGRGSSLGPGTTTQPPRRTGQRNTSLSSVHELTGVERQDSRGSVNFSYPTGSRPTSSHGRLTSPSPQRINPTRITSPANQNLIYDPNTRSFLPAGEIYAIEQKIQDAANKPVKKKKRVAPKEYTGTHLADGTIGGRPRGTAVEAMEAEASRISKPVTTSVPIPAPVPVPIPAQSFEPIGTAPKKKKKKKVVVESDSESDQASYRPNSSADESDLPTEPRVYNTRRGPHLAKKPSIVREDREREEEEEDTTPRRSQAGLVNIDAGSQPFAPTSLSHSAPGRGHRGGQASSSAAFAQDREREHERSASQPAPTSPVIFTTAVGLESQGSVRGGRVQSVSPVRTTHFATTPDSLVVKHQPPLRSVSPRKSALKYPHSPRALSPADETTAGHARGLDSSEASNGTVVVSDELSVPRKKAVRVSFDETNVVVGQAAAPVVTDSPIASSPQSKRGWFSIGRSKRKDSSVSEDDDEVMKPRPALPSFGSVRDKKNTREPVEERQLVKPAEFVESTPPSLPSPPVLTTSTGESAEFPVGQSNDHIVGAIIAQDAISKNAANISKSREPLPPQVLSVEGSGYHSDTDSTISGQDESNAPVMASDMKPVLEQPKIETAHETFVVDRESQTSTPTPIPIPTSNGEIPEITVLQATPILDGTDKEREWRDMPGGWGENSASDSGNDEVSQTAVQHSHTDPTTPATVGIAEPSPMTAILPEIVAENSHAAPAAVPVIIEETEESDTSIYSDAAEDLSDGEGDGFMSLDAVVDSPVLSNAIPGLAITTPPESPTVRTAKERAYQQVRLSKKSSEPDLEEGWDKAQEYWSGLSADKKRQLEQEARDEVAAAEDSESTIEAKPAPKPKKKKKVAVQPIAAEVPQLRQPVKIDRTYMIQPGSKPGLDGHTTVMRSSMRAEPEITAQEPRIRKSMRGPGSMRGSLREDQEPKGSLVKKNRPISLPAPATKTDQAAMKRHVSQLSSASAAAAPAAAQRDMAPPTPVLRRQNSGDSDSSFKRARRSNEGTTFRRSMRGNQPEPQQSPLRSSRFSIRSLSPTGSAFRKPFNAAPPVSQNDTHMRRSMRGSVGAVPSLRGPKPDKSGMRIPGFGRSSSSKPTPGPTRLSRFADSSDEEDARPSFRSRFVDSSDDDDDDEPRPTSSGLGRGTMRSNAAVRAIPKRTGAEDGDSSDLPDSDDEKSPRIPSSPSALKLHKRQNGTAAIVASNQGSNLASGSLRRSGSGRGTLSSPTTVNTISGPPQRPNRSRRGSFMNILRRKKPDPSSKVRKSDAESPARRDTPLERSKSDLQAVKRSESYNSISSTTPRLQKRNGPAWPLVSDSSPKVVDDEDDRPFTADVGSGVVGSEATNGATNGIGARPDIGTRRFTATGVAAVDLNGVVEGKERKKKKFGALRRMLRLDD